MRIYIFSSKFYLLATAKVFKFAILKYYLLEVYITQGKLQLVNMNSPFLYHNYQLSSMTRLLFLFQEKNKTRQNKTKTRSSIYETAAASLPGRLILQGMLLADQVLPQSKQLFNLCFFFFQRNKSGVNLLTQSDKMSQLETWVFKSDFRQACSLHRSSVLPGILHPDWFPPTMVQKNLCHDQT